MSPYKLNDLLIFKSELGNLDSLKVSSIENDFTNQDCNWSYSSTQNEYIRTTLNANICRNHDCGVKILIEKNRRNTRVEISVFRQPGILKLNGSNTTSVTLSSGKKYDSVFTFKNYSRNDEMEAFFWDRTDGLIKYKTNKETFELVGRANYR
ncbi:hypothetical protein [Flavobacterium longum]|uniref:hypothetical protein n=1 Tax=Flavobacterium longum TaxID=1299340 RepID=UPI0039ECFE66